MCTRDLKSCSPNKMSCGGVSKALNVSQNGGRRQTFRGITNKRGGAWGREEGGKGEREMGTDRDRGRQREKYRDRKTETDRGRQADKQAERNNETRTDGNRQRQADVYYR